MSFLTRKQRFKGFIGLTKKKYLLQIYWNCMFQPQRATERLNFSSVPLTCNGCIRNHILRYYIAGKNSM